MCLYMTFHNLSAVQPSVQIVCLCLGLKNLHSKLHRHMIYFYFKRYHCFMKQSYIHWNCKWLPIGFQVFSFTFCFLTLYKYAVLWENGPVSHLSAATDLNLALEKPLVIWRPHNSAGYISSMLDHFYKFCLFLWLDINFIIASLTYKF